jgi:predicted SAM-dependent methyltransferase
VVVYIKKKKMVVRVHLGCGTKRLDGWIHVDAQPQPLLDHQTTIDDLHMFQDNSIDEIYACHVLEHVGRREVIGVLKEWNRVLKVGGIVRISVPDFEAVVDHYQEHRCLQDVMGLVVGGQRDNFDYHCILFTDRSIQDSLQQTGFHEVQRYEWMDFLPIGFDDYSRCYLPHLDFEKGKLMSLNIVASKVEP